MLGKLSYALQRTGSKGREVAFVTVDPERDTPTVLHAYLSHFGKHFIGLSGTRSQIEAVERSFHVWAQRLPSEHGGYDYDEAHSATMFFIGRDGSIVSLHDASDSVGDLSNALHSL
jgi:protein SCO1